MMDNIYLKLTKQFNAGKLRAIISSGQAVVLHHLAIMSKDGDWIIREDDKTVSHILKVLSRYSAHYRFGAPLDIRWLEGGWSSHFEFKYTDLRIRTDFVSRPPRISEDKIKEIWKLRKNQDIPFVDIKTLADIKKTNREKDYVVIGELARMMDDPGEQLLYSRSARDIIALAKKYPGLLKELIGRRELLKTIGKGETAVEKSLDAEKRKLIHANEKRLEKYMSAALDWQKKWPQVEKKIKGHSLIDGHKIVVREAEGILPFYV